MLYPQDVSSHAWLVRPDMLHARCLSTLCRQSLLFSFWVYQFSLPHVSCLGALCSSAGKPGALSSAKSQKKRILAADDLFPLFVYVTIHADVFHPFTCLHSMQEWAPPRYRNSELGYYLITLHSPLY